MLCNFLCNSISFCDICWFINIFLFIFCSNFLIGCSFFDISLCFMTLKIRANI